MGVVMGATGWAAATYTVQVASNYTNVNNYTNCSTGPCANYSFAQMITGSFTVAAALPANFTGGADISNQLVSYSFSDGVNTYTNTDPNARVYQFSVNTDASGNLTVVSLLIQKWQSGSSPHSAGNRVALINFNGPSINQAENNLACSTVGNTTASHVADVCVLAANDSASSIASETAATTWSTPTTTPAPPPPTQTPIPSSFVLLLLGLLIVFGWMQRAAKSRGAR